MTDTAPETASGRERAARAAGKGLTIERVYTTPGVHPYDEVTWERRDVVQTNWKSGETIFEQRGVEFPDFWSVNASTIVTTKYFRGALGTEGREQSLRQLLDRVVLTYTAAGKEHGYFASDGDAEVFEHELTWMLLHQVFSFNSPVWFNVGTNSPAQVSACFILSVDDSMNSILNWYREEGMIFKGGSGAGLNLSRIRSSKELLRSSGGTASGPVSFMRGADASAGTIKSGGATRRAAKMVVLDVDHPDIEEFVETKAREEEKIRVLRDAGFDMDLGGRDITSVQYQNANNSVRVTDEFMRAVEEGSKFGLKARMTGEVIETVDARGLWKKVAQAAWECADPGVQYDDTINDWHTTPESGRITASNPCFPADQRAVTDKGLIRIGDLVTRAAAGESFDIYTNDVTAENDPQARVVATRPVRYMVTGTNQIVSLEFSDGSRLRCTPNHRVWTSNRGWVRAEDLEQDDRIVRSFHFAPRTTASASLPAGARDAVHAVRGKQVDVPEKWTEDLAHYVGWLVGDGCLTEDGAVTVYGSASEVEEILPRHRALLSEVTGFAPKPSVQSNGTQQLRAMRAQWREFLGGLGVTSGRSSEKMLPDSVLEAPQEAVSAFLRGLFDADGTVVNGVGKGTRYVGLGSRSKQLLQGVQELLASLGIFARIHETGVKKGSFSYSREDGTTVTHDSDGPSFDLRISGRSIAAFALHVGFDLSAKHQHLAQVLDGHDAYDTDETVTLVSRALDGWETTYNLTEPRNHSYIVNGVVVANCSEYMHLDNSSCNLASLNLLKFLKDDGSFDAETFAKAVELVITAMDISICFAHFPTEAIGDTTRKFRQLGIGYANLGALLMAAGLAYDSDGGRALAASITSLMTGTSYKRSAELAGVVGPYQGFARNAEAHARVMRKHAAANDAIRTMHGMDEDVQRLATRVWDEGNQLGAKNGWRNAQASVLAPTGTIGFMMDCDTTGIEPDFSLVKFKKLVGGGSMQIVNQTIPRALRKFGYAEETIEAIVDYIAEHGHVVEAPGLRPEHYEIFDCAVGERSIKPMGHVRMMAACQPFLSGAISKCVVGETLLPTGDGLIRIESLHRGEEADTFRDEILEVAGPQGPQKTDAFYYGGVRPVREIVLRSGHKVTGTPNHRVLTASSDGLEWRPLSDLQPGEFVAQQYGSGMWSSVPARFSFTPSVPYGSQEPIRLPEEMTEELAFLLGAYASRGHTSESTDTVVITNSVDTVLRRVQQAWQNVFGLDARIERRDGKCPQVTVSSKTLVEFLRHIGAGTRASDKRIPDAILRSPRAMVLAFLQGLALDAYCSSTQAQAKWGICLDAPALLDDLQAVLTNLGVVHGRIGKRNRENGKTYDEVYASGEWARDMNLLVPFLEPDKAAMADRLLTKAFRPGTSDVVPFLTGRQLYDAIPRSTSGRHGESRRRHFTYLLDSRTRHPTMDTLAEVAAIPGVQLPQEAYDVLEDQIHFSPVESVREGGEREVYDVSVPTTHAFVGNGIVNHNTVNLPSTATVEDVEDVYFQGWKLGLKALAIYRDNSKVGQPLSDDKAKKGDAETAVETVVEYRPTRKRLPKSRPSRTTSFSVGGAEGYMTAGSYPDDGLGEVFLKLGKQGSTLAGVMDAFSIAISIALQYGVPLETYVEKFTNMRFEPAGLTDDPDVRMSQSVMDYVFRRLALDYLPFETRAGLGIHTAEERARQLETGSYEPVGNGSDDDYEGLSQSAPVAAPRPAARAEVAESGAGAATAKSAPIEVHSSTELMEALQGKASDAPMCFTCGTKMRPAGSCYVCEGCGSTSGCS